MKKDSKIFVAGHKGLVGSAMVCELTNRGYTNILTVPKADVDLTLKDATEWWFSVHRPEYVFLCAAKVGGIIANRDNGVEFFLENLRIQDNVISMSHKYDVKKLMFFSSACAYPKFAAIPITEEALLTGTLEPSNECYALAKISGVKLCQAYRRQYERDFISVVPTNLYGLNDHYDLQTSHVLPGMLRRIHEAKGLPEVTLWGSGCPKREFLYADDLAEACLMLMEEYSSEAAVNIGSGDCIPLMKLADKIAECVGYTGKIVWDESKPDGTPKRLLDSSTIRSMGWAPRVPLERGLKKVYTDMVDRCYQK